MQEYKNAKESFTSLAYFYFNLLKSPVSVAKNRHDSSIIFNSVNVHLI